VVGHSLGGGIAMQFSYEYPVFCERLALVDSGGLGPEVHPLLRAATLPGAELVLPLIAHSRLHVVGEAIGQALGRLRLELGHDLAEMIRGYASLSDAEARRAFLHTVRAVIDLAGQRVNATDRLYLAQLIPALIVWGRRGFTHPDRARRGRPSGHAGQPPGDLRRRRPLPPARAARALRPRANRLHREHRPSRVRVLRPGPERAARAHAQDLNVLRERMLKRERRSR
jgi:pimeloyl-ACP methyl ester carboxylesterase